jgi:predicted phosphodiesterase
MITRRTFLKAAGATGLSMPFLSCSRPRALRIGLVADAQYADADPQWGRAYRESPRKLAEAVEHFNGLPLDFCVHLGDLIDRDWRSFDTMTPILEKSRHAFHHVLGNHDFEVEDALKIRAPGRMGMPSRYYSFDRQGFRFVFLDTTEVSVYAHPAASAEYRAGQEELRRGEALGLVQAKPWNSGIGPAQLAWFEAACRDAATRGFPVVVFAHHPILPDGGLNLWNAPALLEAIGRQGAVAAWFNGHNHDGAFAEQNGIPCLTLHGMVETPNTTAYAVLELAPERLQVEGFGREPSWERNLRKVS